LTEIAMTAMRPHKKEAVFPKQTDCFIMLPSNDNEWQDCLPRAWRCNPRINVTFLYIINCKSNLVMVYAQIGKDRHQHPTTPNLFSGFDSHPKKVVGLRNRLMEAKPRRWDHHWESTDECWWSVASLVALVAVKKAPTLGNRLPWEYLLAAICIAISEALAIYIAIYQAPAIWQYILQHIATFIASNNAVGGWL
jgi:hypothetical protein